MKHGRNTDKIQSEIQKCHSFDPILPSLLSVFRPCFIRGSFLFRCLLVLIGVGMAPRPAWAVVDPSDAFFARPAVCHLDIRVRPDQLAKLKAEPRTYIKAKMSENGRIIAGDVALKLKGAAGSFREWTDRPALTLNMQKFHKGGKFHGLIKFHLNNSVQDDVYLNEILSSELFRQAGYPATRVTFARVMLNGRDVGLYVLKEGFDKPFMARSFADPTGNLYDGGFLQDINADLEKDDGDGPDDRSDLKAIVDAIALSDPTERRKRVAALVDIEAFCTFMAIERMISHWDGYCNKTNNYRLYFDPKKQGKAIFLPHGMDQVFGDPNAGLFDPAPALLANEILRNDAFRKIYRARLAALIPLMAPNGAVVRRINDIERRIRPELAAPGDSGAQARRNDQVNDLRQRLVARSANLREQIARPDEPTLAFDAQNSARPGNWSSQSETDNATLDEPDQAGKKSLHIQAGPNQPCIASWRSKVMLSPGEYTIEAKIRTEAVVARDAGEPSGVGVGRSGTDRDQHRLGTIAGETLTCRFPVVDDRSEVTLVLELRAKSGSVWFDRDSIRLIRH